MTCPFIPRVVFSWSSINADGAHPADSLLLPERGLGSLLIPKGILDPKAQHQDTENRQKRCGEDEAPNAEEGAQNREPADDESR